MPEDERTALALSLCEVVTVEGHVLSFHNACLLAMQTPAATVVGGFQQWRRAGRTVRKGEHGAMIWAPTKRHGADDTPAADNGSELAERRHFIAVTVFDVAQTDAVVS
jgi:antirestriction protein ArdC